jgi:hypothetical protein
MAATTNYRSSDPGRSPCPGGASTRTRGVYERLLLPVVPRRFGVMASAHACRCVQSTRSVQ